MQIPVHLNMNLDIVFKKMSVIAQVLGVKVTGISYFNAEKGGIWIIIDPPMSYGSREPWYISHRPYGLVKIVKP